MPSNREYWRDVRRHWRMLKRTSKQAINRNHLLFSLKSQGFSVHVRSFTLLRLFTCAVYFYFIVGINFNHFSKKFNFYGLFIYLQFIFKHPRPFCFVIYAQYFLYFKSTNYSTLENSNIFLRVFGFLFHLLLINRPLILHRIMIGIIYSLLEYRFLSRSQLFLSNRQCLILLSSFYTFQFYKDDDQHKKKNDYAVLLKNWYGLLVPAQFYESHSYHNYCI